MGLFVWILWPGSVIFTAVLCYRVGAYWSSDEHPGRHRAGRMPSQNPWDEEYSEEEEDKGVRRLPPLPVRWWSDEDDTEVLPIVEDDEL